MWSSSKSASVFDSFSCSILVCFVCSFYNTNRLDGTNMKKEERQNHIQNMLNSTGTVTVNEIMQELSVSDMTVRRDLSEMAQRGLLIRTHGGAQRIYPGESSIERSHYEKKSLQEAEKNIIADLASTQISDGETVFLGPGTTLEITAANLKNRNLRIVTNSLPVFDILNRSSSVDLLLVGGEYRPITGAFVGTVSLHSVRNMRFSKAFISVNGIVGNSVYTYSEAEGEIQKAVLDQADEKYLIADSSKFSRYDFYEFYKVSNFDHVITDAAISEETLHQLRAMTDVIIAS